MYKYKVQSNHSLESGSLSSEGSEPEEDTSLLSNLQKCQKALQKVLEIYSKHPNKILSFLEKLDSIFDELLRSIEYCSKIGDLTTLPANHLNSTVYRRLCEDFSVVYDAKLRLYFNRSPVWEYFHRNFREIQQILAACCQTNVAFERKFVTMPQITVARNWGISTLKSPNAMTSSLSSNNLSKTLIISPLSPTLNSTNSQLTRVRSMN